MDSAYKIGFGIVTISDSCHEDPSEDRSGPLLAKLVRDSFQNADLICNILPDERNIIEIHMRKLITESNVRAILTTGGTGFATRDVTPEATKALIDKECPQLAMAIALASLQKTKFAALSRGVCGIAGKTLILNFPGSERAVVECFDVVRDLLPHALHLINDELDLVRRIHTELQSHQATSSTKLKHERHVCPHKTGAGKDDDRHSTFPMMQYSDALDVIYKIVQTNKDTTQWLLDFMSPVNIPPFRASIKDGYAMKSTGLPGTKKVVGYIAAGNEIVSHPLLEDECFKINTGAPIPVAADCVIQVEDTKLQKKNIHGVEEFVDILVEPKPNLDIRPIGYDLVKGDKLFPNNVVDHSPVVVKSLLASVGKKMMIRKPKIGIISTGNELLAPDQEAFTATACKIYDSNTTMLEELLTYFGFGCKQKLVLNDDFDSVFLQLTKLFDSVDFVICSGGVSMGDKDYIKPVLQKLNFDIHFGRVNIKPGKPMTFANKGQKYFFGLPGNPVSAFVTFHLFVLPALRWADGCARDKCQLPIITVELVNESVDLDPRPEYMRASITSKHGKMFAHINGDQISSRLQSIVGADVLVHLPARTLEKTKTQPNEVLQASVLRYDFISKYE